MEDQQICHIFNRGNNRQKIFFCRENYTYFLRKVSRHLKPHLNILAYCLMPNHFHFLVQIKNGFDRYKYSQGLAVTLRSYTRGINKRYNRTGSLFQQHTKVKNISESANPDYYAFICFQYIHQNPLRAKLANRFEEWEWCSFREYLNPSETLFCDTTLAKGLLDFPSDHRAFVAFSKSVISEKDLIFTHETP
ncbi:MAG: putative transposase [Marivirga sp.]